MKSVKVNKEQKALRKAAEAAARLAKQHQYDCPSCKENLRTNSNQCSILCDGFKNFNSGKRTYRFNCKCGVTTQVIIQE